MHSIQTRTKIRNFFAKLARVVFSAAAQVQGIPRRSPPTLSRRGQRAILLKERYGLLPHGPLKNTGLRVESSNWVSALIDETHFFRDEKLRMTAYRAVTKHGQLIWYVFRDGRRVGYPASAGAPATAISEARSIEAARKDASIHWSRVRSFARDLRKGRTHETILLSDAYAAPLSAVSVEGFREAFGLTAYKSMSGRVMAMLAVCDERVAFVLYAAMVRTERLQPIRPQSFPDHQ